MTAVAPPPPLQPARAVVATLRTLPKNQTQRHWVVGVGTRFGTLEYDLEDAVYEYFPQDTGKPAYVVFWTPEAVHIFKHTEVEYKYIGG